MGHASLDVATPRAIVYVETSALIALSQLRASPRATLPSLVLEHNRARKVLGYLEKVRAENGQAVTTLLTFEEIAAKARNSYLRSKAPNGVKALADADATRILNEARTKVLQLLGYAADAASQAKIVVTTPAISASDAVSRARDMRKVHRGLLSDYERIDSMDALHMVYGAELQAKAYISFDEAWKTVSRLEVFGW